MLTALAVLFAPALVEVAWSPSGTMATLTVDGKLTLWNDKGQVIQKFERNSEGTSLALSRDGKVVAIGAEKGAVVWYLNVGGRWTGPRSKTLNGSVQGIGISPDNSLIAGGCTSGFIYIMATETTDFKRVFRESGNGIGSVEFAPDGKTLCSGGQQWRLWDHLARAATRGGTPDSQVWTQGGWTLEVTFAPNGDRVAGIGPTGDADQGHPRSLTVRRSSDGATLKSARFKDVDFSSVDYAPNGKMIAVGTESGEVLLYDATTLEILKSWSVGGPVKSIAYGAGDRLLVATAHSAKVWTTDGKAVVSLGN